MGTVIASRRFDNHALFVHMVYDSNVPRPRTRQERPCDYCGELTFNKKYCSQQHQHTHQRKQLGETWKAGDASVATGAGGGLRTWARQFALEEAGYQCSVCGWNEPHRLTGIPPLQVDHEDGDPWNHAYTNIKVLCPNHHALTDTYGSRNRSTARERNGLPALDREFARPGRMVRYRISGP